MLANTGELLRKAEAGNYAIGGFNIYNLEGVKAVIAAAESTKSPALLQVHPAAYEHGGNGLLALCRVYAEESTVPVAVHLDHSTSTKDIEAALKSGVSSVMADGSHLALEENIAFVRSAVEKANAAGATVEGELGRISGTEDGLTVEMIDARMTNPDEAKDFVAHTGIDMLAVCIGNIHGKYPFPPQLDFERLKAIHDCVDVPLVMHGASGLEEGDIKRSIELGIRKFNVNTEVRNAYLQTLRDCMAQTQKMDLVTIMQHAENVMKTVIIEHMVFFGSAGQA